MKKILTNKEIPKPIFLFILISCSCGLFMYGMLTIISTLGLYSTVISGNSMENTLCDGSKILLINANIKQIKRGDLVSIAAYSDGQYINIIKRIIGMPNETIDIKGKDVYIDDTLLEEPYAYYSTDSTNNLHFILGENEYFFMGDNRIISLDSRKLGPISKESIVSIIWKYKSIK